MGTPLVTVISVSYNHSRYIKENLDSIKNQTYKNIQLIVGDDASSDNSAKVFQEWLQSNRERKPEIHKKWLEIEEQINAE